MRAYSQDLRERVLRAVDLGRPRAEIVQLFGVSLATIKRYLKQRREEGHVRPKAIPGRPPRKQAHKSVRVRLAIEAKGCQLLFLPGYSPDLSPIEEAFSKLKTVLRRAGARTREALEEAIGQALLTITAQDAQGWFQHCGYLLPAQER